MNKNLDVIVTEAARRYLVEDERAGKVMQAMEAKIQQAYVDGVLMGFDLARDMIAQAQQRTLRDAANDGAGGLVG